MRPSIRPRFKLRIAEVRHPGGLQQISPNPFDGEIAMFAKSVFAKSVFAKSIFSTSVYSKSRNKRVMTATTFAGTLCAATVFAAGLVTAQPAKTVKLNYSNGSKVEIQVYTVDRVSKQTVEKKNMITPGGSDSSQAVVDKDGNIDILFSIVGKNDQGVSEYHCKAVKTSAASASATVKLEFEKLGKC
jgi:hypothetical protein